MNEDLKHSIRFSTSSLQSVDLADEDIDVVLPAVERNAALVAGLAPRVAFEDEPSLYTDVMQSAKG